MSGILYVVATPIGNLGDMTSRAVDTLRTVDLIAAEDTRHTQRLLSHFGVGTPTLALHEHNEDARSQSLVERLRSGETIALVSDAGTPLLSDPGYRLISLARAAGITVVPVPGASAVTAALSVSGLPTDRFCFEGFLPAKAQARRDTLGRLSGEARTLVFFESVHRIGDMLTDLAASFGAERPAFLGRELSKRHEQCVRATLGELADAVAAGTVPSKGEFVIVVGGCDDPPDSGADVDPLLLELSRALPASQAAAIAARVTGLRRNALYRRLLEMAESRNDDSG